MNGNSFWSGSQAAHAGIAHLPHAMQQSGELDIYPLRRPELADVIDGAIGEGSAFHETFGYYAQGIGPDTAKLPHGWRQRAIEISNPMTGGATGIAPEIHDLCASKLVAMRQKDLDYTEAALNANLVQPSILLERLAEIDQAPEEARRQASTWLSGQISRRRNRSDDQR